MKIKKIAFLLYAVTLIIFGTGCSGGVGGDGSKDYSGSTPIIRGNAFNDQGWENIAKGQYDAAISSFNKVVADNPTDDELSEAYNGIGWARSFKGKLSDGKQWFEKAVHNSDDAKVGLAGAYLQEASRTDMEKVIELLYEDIGKGQAHFVYKPRRSVGVTNAEVHAILAYACAATERDEMAREQLEYAEEIATDGGSAIFKQLVEVIEFVLK